MPIDVKRQGSRRAADRCADGDRAGVPIEDLLPAISLRLERDDTSSKSQKHLCLQTVVRADVEAEIAGPDELAIELAFATEVVQILAIEDVTVDPSSVGYKPRRREMRFMTA